MAVVELDCTVFIVQFIFYAPSTDGFMIRDLWFTDRDSYVIGFRIGCMTGRASGL